MLLLITRYSLFILGFIKTTINSDVFKYGNCFISNKQSKYPILPGMGWDNLENKEMGKVFDLKFSKCKYSDDNHYLIPDKVSLYPKRSSEVELYSESFDHFMNYSSTTSKSMKFEAEGFIKLFTLGGQFSYENERVKSYQLGTRSKILRVQLRYNLYKSFSEPDTPLHPNFMSRITQLAQWIRRYNETFYSSFLADMIIRDFGTHVIRSIDAGAILSKVDFLSSEFVRQMNLRNTNIGASATASFINSFKLNNNIKMKFTEEQIDEYNKNCMKTILKSYGGFPIGTDINLDKWVASLKENLVPIDRTGDPIYYILNRKVLPNFSNNIIHKISNLLMDSVERYYKANSRKGCLDMNSPSFNSDANLDGKNCKEPIVYFNFGGVYSTCSGEIDQCTDISRPNPLTGSHSCPNGFTSVLLNEGLNACRSYCHKKWIFFSECETKCSYFQLYWCYPLNYSPNHNGYRFGGFIDSQMPTCPMGYFPIKFTDATELCVTNDANAKNPYAIGFGGFFSCKVGNPLARAFFKDEKNNLRSSLNSKENWLHECADGYVAHIAAIDRICQISYCTESNKFTLGSLPDLKRPPFFKVSYAFNDTISKILYSKKGEMFIVNFNPNSFNDLSKIKTTKSAFVIVLLCLFGIFKIIIIIGIIVYRHRKHKKIILKKSFINSQGKTVCYGTLDEDESLYTESM